MPLVSRSAGLPRFTLLLALALGGRVGWLAARGLPEDKTIGQAAGLPPGSFRPLPEAESGAGVAGDHVRPPSAGPVVPSLRRILVHPTFVRRGETVLLAVEVDCALAADLVIKAELAAAGDPGRGRLLLSPQPGSGLHELQWQVPEDAATGPWHVRLISIADSKGHERVYRSSEHPELGGTDFIVVDG